MKAVMYGGGNIGRGFIGMLFSESGYEVTFVDVAETVVEQLQKKGEYPLRYVSGRGHEDLRVRPVTAVNGKYMEQTAFLMRRQRQNRLRSLRSWALEICRSAWQRHSIHFLMMQVCQVRLEAFQLWYGILKCQQEQVLS